MNKKDRLTYSNSSYTLPFAIILAVVLLFFLHFLHSLMPAWAIQRISIPTINLVIELYLLISLAVCFIFLITASIIGYFYLDPLIMRRRCRQKIILLITSKAFNTSEALCRQHLIWIGIYLSRCCLLERMKVFQGINFYRFISIVVEATGKEELDVKNILDGNITYTSYKNGVYYFD